MIINIMVDPLVLQKYALFGGLLEEQISFVISLMEEENYSPDDDIIVEGQPNGKLRFILEGRVVVTKEKIILSEFGEGETVGEMEILDVMPSAATIKALSATKIMSISNKALREIYKNDTKTFALIIMNLARELSRRLRRMDDRVTSVL